MTFSDVYEEWSKRKFPAISESNVKGYTASYKSCESLYNKVFKHIKLVDLQTVIDTCGKNFPTLKKIKVLFNQLFDYALKNDICNKYYSSFVDIAQYKDRNPNKYDRNKKVPIADKVLPYYKAWYESCPECEYLLHTEDGKHFEYRNYYDSYFKPLMEQLGINRTPYCCRHTCISMLAEAGINQTFIKKIVGHSGAMTLTEKVYTHFDIKELVYVINRI